MQLAANSFLISGFVSLALFLFALFIGSAFTRPKVLQLEERIVGASGVLNELPNEGASEQTWYGRRVYTPFVKPIFKSNPTRLQRISRMLSIDLEKLHHDIKEAGMGNKISAEEIVSMKLIGLVFAAILVILGLPSFDLYLFVGGLSAYLIGSYMPSKRIATAIHNRRESIRSDLPDFLRLLKAVTESGNTIQEAINKVAVRLSGPLAEQFQQVMIETKANGGNWRVAMENMALRNDIDELSDVVSNILISVERGTSIVSVLEKDADIMLELRNSKVMEQARKLSVRMMIPMAVFDFLPLMVLMIAPMMMSFVGEL